MGRMFYGYDYTDYDQPQGAVNVNNSGDLEGIFLDGQQVPQNIDYNRLVSASPLPYVAGGPGSNKAIVDVRGIPEAGPDLLTVTPNPSGTFHFRIAYPKRTEEVVKKKGFLGGGLGGVVGAIAGLALAVPTGGASLTWTAAALAASGGAALGTLIGSGAEAAITGTKFVVGGELANAAISGAGAGAAIRGPKFVVGDGLANAAISGAVAGATAGVGTGIGGTGGKVAAAAITTGSTFIPRVGGSPDPVPMVRTVTPSGAVTYVQAPAGTTSTRFDGLDLVTQPAAGADPRAIAGATYPAVAGATPDPAPPSEPLAFVLLIVFVGGLMLLGRRHGA